MAAPTIGLLVYGFALRVDRPGPSRRQSARCHDGRAMQLTAGGVPMKPRLLLGSGLIGALDQALLSAFNLALGVAFIKLAVKADYADYALVATALLLLQSLQNALVNSPLATLLPAATDDARRAEVQRAGEMVQGWLQLAVVLLGALVLATLLLTDRAPALPLAGATLLAGLGTLSREFTRAQCFLRHDAPAALRSDLLYVLVASLGLSALLWQGGIAAAPVLAVVGAAGLLASLLMQGGGAAALWRRLHRPAPVHWVGLRALWGCARWALPSVVNSWLYGNAYLFLVERLLSKDAVADLSASRLLLVPMSLLVVGWASAFRPLASRWLANEQVRQVNRVALRSALVFVVVGIAYGALLHGLMPLLQAGLLGEKYRSAGQLAPLWLLFFMSTAVRTVGMSAMLASSKAFRTLFHYGWAALAVAVPGVWLACIGGNLAGVLLALLAAELVLLALVWWRGWPAIRRDALQGGA